MSEMNGNELLGIQLPHVVDAIFFDKDGTLLDFTVMWGYWADIVMADFQIKLASRGLQLVSEDIPQIWGTIHDEQGHMIHYDVRGPLAMGTLDEMQAVLTWVGYRAGLSWGESKKMVYDILIEANLVMEKDRPARALPGLPEFLEQCRLKGIPMGVVTADETQNAIQHLQWMGIESYFTVIIGTDQVERGKPFPDMLQLACTRLGVQIDRCVVIGDTDGDMEMARAAGDAYRVGIGEPGQLALANVTIRSFRELLNGGLQ